jgi:anaerobic selenocysteine-containing dehydrogenase
MTAPASSRRRFLEIVVLGAAAVPVAASLAPSVARAQAGLPHIEESDATASALGYRHDSTQVDAAKFPNHKAEQVCGSCNLGQAAQADGWLPCSIFPGKAVNPKGWCAAWVKKV